MTDTLGISLACVVFVILLFWFLIGTKGHWILKLVMSAVSLYFCACLLFTLNGLLGWPTDESLLNKKIQVLWLDVHTPNKNKGDTGAIYIWARTLDPEIEKNPYLISFRLKSHGNEPRVYKLEYSEELNKQAQQMKRMIGQGGKFFGELKEGGMEGGDPNGQGKGGKGKGKGKGKGRGKKGEDGGGGSLSQEQEAPLFYQLPPPHFQDKESVDIN